MTIIRIALECVNQHDQAASRLWWNMLNTALTENKRMEDLDLILEKPLYVNGFDGLHMYINSLMAADGEAHETERGGSMSADGVNGLVDIYMTSIAGNCY